jgi:hypothetical protein
MALQYRLRPSDATAAHRPTDGTSLTARDEMPAGRVRSGARILTPLPPAGPLPTAGPPRAGRRTAAPGPAALPPSVARVAARTRLSAELLAAILEVDDRRRPTLDDIEHADALAARLLARRAERQRTAPARADAHLRPAADIRLAG